MVLPSIALSIRTMYASGNYTKKEIADYFSIHRQTVSNILNRSEDKDVYARTSQPGNLLIMPYLKVIEGWLKNSEMSATTIYNKLIHQGAKLSLSTVVKAVKKIKYDLDIAAIRYETEKRKQSQADWGTFKGYTANINGVERQLYGFFLILGYSRMKYVEFTTDMTTDTLIQCIENAFHYFGGRTEEILFDNMPQIVNKSLIDPDSLGRALLPQVTAFSEYYGFEVRLARIRRPQEKGKVERFVGEFKESFIPQLEKKTSHDIRDLNVKALAWCDEVNAKVHSTTNRIPSEAVIEEELIPLPEIRYLDNHTVTVSSEGYIHYRGEIYSVDNHLARCTGEIIDMENTIFLKVDGEFLILGRRNLPVYIRHYYSHTKKDWRVKQKKRNPKAIGSFSQWIGENFLKISIDWKTMSCKMQPMEVKPCA